MYPIPTILQPVSTLLHTLTQPIHPSLFPVACLPIIHACRISIAYRTLNKQAGGTTSAVANLAGFLLMAWGGSMVSHVLLSLPIPQLLSFGPMIVYGTTHFCLPDIARLPSMKTLDCMFPLVDALIRTTSIAAGVEACRHHPSSAAIRDSLSIQLFIGAIVSSAGTIAAQSLCIWEPVWRLNRPTFLQHGTLLAATDVWAGALVAAIYGALTASHPDYPRLIRSLYPLAATHNPILSSIDAKAAAASVLTLIYSWRVYRVHYSNKMVSKIHQDNEKSKSKKE